MTICEKFKSSVRERLKEHKSLYVIGMELCDGVDDPRGKALRVVKDILKEDKIDVEKYLIDNADWLEYQAQHKDISKGNNILLPFATSILGEQNIPLNSVSKPEPRYKLKSIVASSPSKETNIPSKETTVLPIEKDRKANQEKEIKKFYKSVFKPTKAYDDTCILECVKALNILDNIDISKMKNETDIKCVKERIEKIRDKCNSILLSPDDIQVVSEK
jgi:hypothetical protein